MKDVKFILSFTYYLLTACSVPCNFSMSLLNTYEKTNITTFVKSKISEGIWIRIYTIRRIDIHFQNIGQLNLTTHVWER